MTDRWSPQKEEFDRWDIAANRHFMAYMMRVMAENPRAWGAPNSAEQARTVRKFVAYKNAWATDMREEAVNGEVPVERQKLTWAGCMKRAESELRA